MSGPFNFNDRPFIVIWEATRACALACRHCRATAIQERHPLELNTPEALRLIDQIQEANPSLFVITGGDPVRRPDLKVLIQYAASKGLRVGLSPSATPDLIDQNFSELKALGVARLSLSIDGATRESHDRFRGVPGTWDLTMAAIHKAEKAGLPIQINTTFTQQNLHEFDAFVALLSVVKPVLWSVFQLVPTGRGKSEDLLSADEMESLFLKLHNLSDSTPYDIKTTEGHHYRRVVVQQSRSTKSLQIRAPLGVNDGKGFAFISHLGEIFPSGFLPIPTGNVRQSNLLEVYRFHPVFQQLRDPSLLEGKCQRCSFKSLCGGSRARAFAMTGNFLAEEPLCSYQPPQLSQVA